MENKRVGVIGTGGMGRHHARIYSELGVLATICDVNPDNGGTLARKFEVDYVKHYKELAGCELDAVSIAVPTPLHCEIACWCLDQRLDVLLEKPMSDNIEDCRKIIGHQKSSKLAVGYIERYNPAYQMLKALVEAKTFGEVVAVSIKRVGGEPRTATNVVVDLMTHDFSLILPLLGTPDNVYSSCHEQDGIVNSAHVLLDYPHCSATCESNWVSPVKIRDIHLTGTEGYCHVNLINQEITRFESNMYSGTTATSNEFVTQFGKPSSVNIEVYKQEPLKLEIESFLNGGPIVTGEEALDILSLTLLAADQEHGNA